MCKKSDPPEGSNKGEDAIEHPAKPAKERRAVTPFPDVFQEIKDRGIRKDTAEKYKVFELGDKRYYPNFEGHGKNIKHIGNKVKDKNDKNKQFYEGENGGPLFGQHLFPPGSANAITVTEGEDDTLAGYELLGSKYPVVSVLNGTGSAARDFKNNYEYLDSFEEIVINFDSDEPGQKAAKEVASLGFAPGKIRVLQLARAKDANDYLKMGLLPIYSKEWWKAPKFMPDGIKIGTNMWDEIINRPKHFQVDYPFYGLNKMTYGMRLSELVVLTADTGIGKTSVLKEIEYGLLMNEELKEKKYGIGFLHLEEPNYDTALGLMSIHDNRPYHLPDTPRDAEQLRAAYDATINSDRVVIWDHFGSNTVDAVLEKVRHMHALGCKYIVLDHLSIVVSDQAGDERKQLDEITTKLKTLCMNLNIALLCVIHQNRQGMIRGTAGVEQLANIVMKMVREHEHPDAWRRNVTKITIQKNRFCGRTGPACYLWYNEMTGRLMELDQEEIDRYENGEGKRDDEMPF